MGNLVSAENVEPTKQKMKKEKNMASNIEVLGHALGGVGQNTVYALWSGFITAFYTDVFGMNPAVMAAIFLFARIWDGINDPMMGILADRSKSRFVVGCCVCRQ